MAAKDLSKLTREEKIRMVEGKKKQLVLSQLSREEKEALVAQKQQEALEQEPDDFEEDPGFLGEVGRFAKAAGSGAAFGFGPEIAAGVAEVGEALGLADDIPYEERVDEYAEQLRRESEASPWATGVGEVAGMMVPGAGILKGAQKVGKGIKALSKTPKLRGILETAGAASLEGGLYTPGVEEGQKRSEQDLLDPVGRAEQATISGALGGALGAIPAAKKMLFGEKALGPTGAAAKNVRRFDLSELGIKGSEIAKITRTKGPGYLDELLDYADNVGLSQADDATDAFVKVSSMKDEIGQGLEQFYKQAGEMEKRGSIKVSDFSRFKPIRNLVKELNAQNVGPKEKKKIVRAAADILQPIHHKQSTIDDLWRIRKNLDKKAKWRLETSEPKRDAFRFLRDEIDDQITKRIDEYGDIKEGVPEVLDWVKSQNKEYGYIKRLHDSLSKKAGSEETFRSLSLDTVKKSVTDPMLIGTQRVAAQPFAERMASVLTPKPFEGGLIPAVSAKLGEGAPGIAEPETVEIPQEWTTELIEDINARTDISVLERAKLKSSINKSLRDNQPVTMDPDMIRKLYPPMERQPQSNFGLNNIREVLQGVR